MVLQRLHIALGRSGILIQNFCDDLGGHTEVPRHISYSIFFNSQSKHLLHSPTRGLGSFIYENTDSVSAFLLAEGAFALFTGRLWAYGFGLPLGLGRLLLEGRDPLFAEGACRCGHPWQRFCRSAVFGGSAGTGLFCALVGHSCAAALLLAGRLTGDACGSAPFSSGTSCFLGRLMPRRGSFSCWTASLFRSAGPLGL